ncbi:hypothetical protein [Streptomyces axinellae]|uniref:Uncharacterized protein n=1 Tax=Streptomyces axinellae TaxID=552788 RepID=A0ABP6CE95_9ACTN
MRIPPAAGPVQRTRAAAGESTADSVATFQKGKFPTGGVCRDDGTSELHLITCGGEFAKERHRDSSVLVFTGLKGRIRAWAPGAAPP